MATGGVNDPEIGTDETFEFLCSLCLRKNTNVEAQKFCTDCQDYFCSTCVSTHNDFPALKSHHILDKATFPPGSGVQLPVVPTDRCSVHGHKPVDMFCRQCNAVGCSTCMVMNHSSCQGKCYVPEYIKSNSSEADSTAITEQLNSIASCLNDLQKTFVKEKQQLKTKYDLALQQIRKFRIQINQRLDELEKNTVQELDCRFQSLKDKTESILRELQPSLAAVESAQNSLKSAKGNISQMFVSIKIANVVASQATETVTEIQCQVSSAELSFVSNQRLQFLLNEIEFLGSPRLKEKFKHLPRSLSLPTAATNQTNPKAHGSRTSPSLMQIKDSKKYKVTEKFDKRKHSVLSVCTLEDGTVIVAFNRNNTLNRFHSSSYKIRDSCTVHQYPWQVCAISNQDVAVSCYVNQFIQFISVGRTLQKTRQINTGFQCYALAYCEGYLFISDAHTSVYVYAVSGERLQQFSVPQSDHWVFTPIDIYSIAVSNSKIYVAHRRKGLIVLDRNGKLVAQFNEPELKEACGVCLYMDNSVLVCGNESNNVLQFNPEGVLIGVVLKRSESCKAVSWCMKSSKLIVGLRDEMEVNVV